MFEVSLFTVKFLRADPIELCLCAGASKSSVTAGLIGGRLGNKGGVGISLNIAGSSFLFVNAHLAGAYFSHHRLEVIDVDGSS